MTMPCTKCHPKQYIEHPKVLYFDTELSTTEGKFYGRKYDTNIMRVTKYWYYHMYSYSFGDGKVHVVQSFDEKKLVISMRNLIDKCDIVIAHNLNFDLGHLYMKCLQYGIAVPKEPKRVCTLKMYRKLCPGGFSSNSLKDISKELGLTPKKELPKEFWFDYEDNPTKGRIKIAKEYAKGDIVTLREIYKAIAPFFPQIRIKRKVI